MNATRSIACHAFTKRISSNAFSTVSKIPSAAAISVSRTAAPDQYDVSFPRRRVFKAPSGNAFDALVRDINTTLDASGHVDQAGINLRLLTRLLSRYSSIENDWEPYAFADTSMAYTRNLVDNGNGKSNLLLLVWTPGKASPIHDHADAHCLMKVLKGRLEETLYQWPAQHTESRNDAARDATSHTSSPSPASSPAISESIPIRRHSIYRSGQVAYMSDRMGLHRIANPSADEFAVSLHLYTPPHAASRGCHVFEETTGSSIHVPPARFYSEFGVKL